MLKKVVLTVASIMLLIFSASMVYANQTGGMTSGTGTALPTTLTASLNPGGLGDSLLYGYYNVRGNLNLFNVVNTDTINGQKVRVIFRNAKNSKECLDFSVCLSRGDVWTAYLVDDGTTARIYQFDQDTITAPLIPATGKAFISGTYTDVGTVLPDDCREGYFEVVGLSEIPLYDKDTCGTADLIDCPKTEATCRDFVSTVSVPNVLMGNNTIFDLSTLATYAYNAVAVADTTPGVPLTPPAGQDYSIPFAMFDGCVGADYIFTKSSVISPYDIISGLGGETELILTFPTRLACHNTVNTMALFDGKVDANSGLIKFCTGITTTIWDDKEHKQDITDFSPGLTLCLPYELNVIRIGGSHIWNSTVDKTIDTTFDLGWIEIGLTGANHFTTMDAVTTSGLPVVAHTTQSFVAGSASYMVPTAWRNLIGRLLP